MHQSSLGSLFLLMPDKLAPQWWSPVMPVSFLLSAIAAERRSSSSSRCGSRKHGRDGCGQRDASMGKITFWALLVYVVFRLGDLRSAEQLAGAFSGKMGALFAAESSWGAWCPWLYWPPGPETCAPRTVLRSAVCALGVIFNRINVVLWAMDLRGAMPQNAPEPYTPSLVEWGISIGLIAAAMFLFGLGVRLFPVLPVEDAAREAAV